MTTRTVKSLQFFSLLKIFEEINRILITSIIKANRVEEKLNCFTRAEDIYTEIGCRHEKFYIFEIAQTNFRFGCADIKCSELFADLARNSNTEIIARQYEELEKEYLQNLERVLTIVENSLYPDHKKFTVEYNQLQPVHMCWRFEKTTSKGNVSQLFELVKSGRAYNFKLIGEDEE